MTWGLSQPAIWSTTGSELVTTRIALPRRSGPAMCVATWATGGPERPGRHADPLGQLGHGDPRHVVEHGGDELAARVRPDRRGLDRGFVRRSVGGRHRLIPMVRPAVG